MQLYNQRGTADKFLKSIVSFFKFLRIFLLITTIIYIFGNVFIIVAIQWQ